MLAERDGHLPGAGLGARVRLRDVAHGTRRDTLGPQPRHPGFGGIGGEDRLELGEELRLVAQAIEAVPEALVDGQLWTTDGAAEPLQFDWVAAPSVRKPAVGKAA